MATPTCLRHPGLPSEGNCARCGAPFCANCRVEALALEQVYCSAECRDLEAGVGRPLGADTSGLAEGASRPLRTGAALWAASFTTLATHLLPVAFGLALLLWLGGSALEQALDESHGMTSGFTLAGWALFGYGGALTAVLMTQVHTEFVEGNAYLWTFRRFLPWAITWLIVGALVFAGLLLLILPGLVLGIRLFWADEFALVLRAGPVESVRSSWRLTRGRTWQVFGFQFVLGCLEYLILIPGFLIGIAIHMTAQESGLGAYPAVQVVVSTAVFLIAFLTYAAAHAAEVTYFYGIRAQNQGN